MGSSIIVFTKQEQEDGMHFCNFFNRNFILKKSGAFKHPLTAENLLDIYQVKEPNTVLCEATMEHLLTHGCFQSENGAGVSCSARPDEFAILPEPIQKRILYYATTAYEVQLGNLMSRLPKGILPKSMHMFLELYVYNKKTFKYFNMLEAPRQRTSVTELYRYYNNVCLYHNWDGLGKTDFCAILEKNGFVKRQAYCYTSEKKQGTLAFLNIAIPYRADEQSMSIQKGMSIMFLSNKYVMTDGSIMGDFIDGFVYDQYRKNRVEEAGKAYGNEQEKIPQEAGSVNRPEDAIFCKPTPSRAKQDNASSNTTTTSSVLSKTGNTRDGGIIQDNGPRPISTNIKDTGASNNGHIGPDLRTDKHVNSSVENDRRTETNSIIPQPNSSKIQYPINIDEGIYNDIFDICSEEIKLTRERAEEIVEEYNADYKTKVDIDDIWDTLKEALL